MSDAICSDYEQSVRLLLMRDFEIYAKKCLKVRPTSGEITPFLLNMEQRDLHSRLQAQLNTKGKIRAIILKGRQQGISTYIQARIFWRLSHLAGRYAFILTHEERATKNIFAITNRFYENCPEIFRPQRDISNPKEMIFGEIDSGYAVGTARNKDVGRSWTLQYFHGSEVAFWMHADDHCKGILQSIPRDDGTEIYLESTANGTGNYFQQQWELATTGESEFEAIFYPWFYHESYKISVDVSFKLSYEEKEIADTYKLSNEQMLWRRVKIAELGGMGKNGEKAFRQEYPCNPVEAFDSSGDDFLIRSDLVVAARKSTGIEAIGKLFIGVDPARFGNDLTAIIRRRGRVVYNLQYYHKIDTMSVASKVAQIIRDESPDKVFVDVGGLGAGVYDRLKEEGFSEIIIAVNSGEKSYYEDKYFNKRAEMWGQMALWFQEGGVSIPDDTSLHSDLVNIGCVNEVHGRLQLEKKEYAKKRIGRSPDGGDALALTFAHATRNDEALSDSAVDELMNYKNRAQMFGGNSYAR